MISLDTNVLVRVVTGDDPEQVEVARQLFEEEALFVSKTVCVELEWVLRYSYSLDAPTIIGIFLKLLGHRRIHWEDRQALGVALEWSEAGMDFADALHLASSAQAERFATFDRRLRNRASECDSSPPVELLTVE